MIEYNFMAFTSLKFPNQVFEKKWEKYYFFDALIVLCNDDAEIFSEKVNEIIKYEKKSIQVFPIGIVDSIWQGFDIKVEDDNDAYVNGINKETENTVSLRSTPNSIGIISDNSTWAIYCEASNDIAVLGFNKKEEEFFKQTFEGLILKRSEIFDLFKLSYKNEEDAKRDFMMIEKNYDIF